MYEKFKLVAGKPGRWGGVGFLNVGLLEKAGFRLDSPVRSGAEASKSPAACRGR